MTRILTLLLLCGPAPPAPYAAPWQAALPLAPAAAHAAAPATPHAAAPATATAAATKSEEDKLVFALASSSAAASRAFRLQ